MTDTPNLGLPLLAAGQAQKHVTHNEALLDLDALVMCAVQDKDLAAPPASPPDGARYIVAGGASGAWAGRAAQVAAFQDGAWAFHAPRPGFLAYVVDEGAFYGFDGGAWATLGTALGPLQNLARLGLGTTADATNAFAAKLDGALWTARPVSEGGAGDLRVALNKEAAGNVLSLLFQTGYSGRAELGLLGSDALSLKVSPDGSAWTTALSVAADGALSSRRHVPAADNAHTLGAGGARWSTVYAATGAINTSDARLKTPVAALADPEVAAARDLAREIGAFRFLEAVARKGEAARLHVGLTVQAAIDVMARHGLDPLRYGFICRDEVEGGDVHGFRSDELALFLIRGLEARLTALEALRPPSRSASA